MIIGLTGKKQSGKDTVCLMIQRLVENEVERRAFADKLKQSAAALLDTTVELLDEWKLDERYVIEGGHWNIFEADREFKMSFREFLQRYGTEAHRDVFGDHFWLQQCLPNTNPQFYIDDPRLIVVTDVRFLNEAKWIRQLGGWVWKIRRDELDSGDTHPSEVELEQIEPDITINNNGSLADLENRVKESLVYYGFKLR